MVSVTIVSNSALWCDALSTSVFINGKQFAESLHKKIPGYSDINYKRIS